MTTQTYTLADAATGLFRPGELTCRADLVERNTPPGCVAVPGAHDPEAARLDVETGEVVAYAPPAPPTADLTAEALREALAERARRLAASDWVVTRAIERDEPAPAAWRTYRQALRDITDQPGFPTDIEWPTPPGA